MTANEYQKAALRTADMNYSEYSMIMNGALGLCGEAGEVADIIKKATFQGHPLDAEHIAEELGDVAWYLAIIQHYEMPDDYTWLCKEQLKKIGVDVEAWNRERGSIHDIREQ